MNGILTLQSGDPNPAQTSIDKWLNAAAFVPAAARTPGNAPRNLPSTRTDALKNLDASLLKDMHFTEK